MIQMIFKITQRKPCFRETKLDKQINYLFDCCDFWKMYTVQILWDFQILEKCAIFSKFSEISVIKPNGYS